ncbi:MAG: T9SS type A sorting domain-containing protein [Bacteroidota bacterium]
MRKVQPLISIFLWLGLTVYPGAGMAQVNWSVSHPAKLINGYFHLSSPPNSDRFYGLGYDLWTYDPTLGEQESIALLPEGVFAKEGIGSYSAPFRHIAMDWRSEQAGHLIHRDSIYRTQDGGQTWAVQHSLAPNTAYQSSSYFTGLDFPADSIGYAVGTGDKIFKTTDAGASWQQLQWSTSTAPYRYLSSVTFVDDSVGFVAGYEVDDIHLNIGAYRPLVYRTEDGGQSWTETQLAETDHHFYRVYPVGNQTLYLTMVNRNYVLPADRLLKSTDNGTTWSEIDLPGISPLTSLVIRGAHWFSAQEGVLLGSPELTGDSVHIYRTEDGGANWNKIDLSQGIKPAFRKVPNLALSFSGDKGLITGATGNMLTSIDRGQTWNIVQNGQPDIYDLSVQGGEMFAAAFGDLILRKLADQWIPILTPSHPSQLETGFTKIANWGADNIAVVDITQGLFWSENGGITWESLFFDLDTVVYDVLYSNGDLMVLAWVRSVEDLLILTRDAGTGTWIDQFIADRGVVANGRLEGRGGNSFYAVADNDIFVTNNGLQWTPATNIPGDAWTTSFHMDSSGVGVMQDLGNGGMFFTQDAGNSWNTSSFTPSVKAHIDFSLSSLRGFTRLDDGRHLAFWHATPDQNARYWTRVLISADSGATWDLIPSPYRHEPVELGVRAYTVIAGELYLGGPQASILKLEIDETTSKDDPLTGPRLKVSPNPFSHEVRLTGLEHQATYQIITLEGKVIQQGGVYPHQPGIVLAETLAAGVYILEVGIGKSRQQFKLVKQ